MAKHMFEDWWHNKSMWIVSETKLVVTSGDGGTVEGFWTLTPEDEKPLEGCNHILLDEDGSDPHQDPGLPKDEEKWVKKQLAVWTAGPNEAIPRLGTPRMRLKTCWLEVHNGLVLQHELREEVHEDLTCALTQEGLLYGVFVCCADSHFVYLSHKYLQQRWHNLGPFQSRCISRCVAGIPKQLHNRKYWPEWLQQQFEDADQVLTFIDKPHPGHRGPTGATGVHEPAPPATEEMMHEIAEWNSKVDKESELKVRVRQWLHDAT